MQLDSYTRLVLGVIAAALCVIAAAELGWIGPGALSRVGASIDSSEEEGSFALLPIPATRKLLRYNARTGETWHTKLSNPVKWTRVGEPEKAAEDIPDAENRNGAESLAGGEEAEGSDRDRD